MEALGAILERLDRLTAAVEAMNRRAPALVTIPQAAEALGVSTDTIRRRIKRGEIPHRRLGRAIRLDLSQLAPPASQ